jgi:minor extracellular serine protease Vpr
VKRSIPRVAAATASASALVLLLAAPSGAQPASPASTDSLLIPDGPITTVVEPSLFAATGTVTVSIELAAPSVAEAVGAEAKQRGAALSRAEQRRHARGLQERQQAFLERIAHTGATEVTTTQLASNLVVVDVDASKIGELAADAEAAKILPVIDHEVHLGETVPHIGATAVQDLGVTGAGVRVAVLDTGIDYTHEAFGGEGTIEAYLAAYGLSVDDPTNTQRNGLFPTDKVVEGFDFVGEFWPLDGAPLNPNPDPIDCGPATTPAPCTGGHGTTVAAILAGADGVAPDAKLYAYKVCSSVASSCSGVALLQAFEAALDPYGTGDIEDAVDIINLSLGALYGQIENATSGAAANAARMGVTVVASAGNSADKPYITGSPASTPEVLSVAWTEVPSAVHLELTVLSPDDIAGSYLETNTVGWAPITDGFHGELAYGTTTQERLGCFLDGDGQPSPNVTDTSPYPPGFFDGKVALIDRGVCAVSFKTHNAAEAGAIAVIVANNVPGAAPSFSFGPIDPFNEVQTLIISLPHGNTLKAGLATGEPVIVEVDPDEGVSLINTVNPSSSRGPNVSEKAIKPEIGAPGASTAAEAGTGTGTRVFGGTSGAAPMVAGAAALLLEAYPDRTPLEIKAVLMNTAETEIFIQPALRPGELTEISRIGGGEVRVDRAHASQTAAWSEEDQSAGVSFGYHTVQNLTALRKTITIKNYSDQLRIYNLSTSFRHDDDAASGAVTLLTPPAVAVGAGQTGAVQVIMMINPSKLPDWVQHGGATGDQGILLRENEFDGFIHVSGGGDDIHLPWHVLPQRVSDVRAPSTVQLTGDTGMAAMVNPVTSGQAGDGDVFALTGTSDPLPPEALPGEGDGFAVVDLAAVGVRFAGNHPALGPLVQFAVNTHNDRSHPNAPGNFHVLIDATGDGSADFQVINWDLQFPTGIGDGRNVTWIVNLETGGVSGFFFTDANLNSSNTIMTVPMAAVGLTPDTQFTFDVLGVDLYFTGATTDAITGMTHTVGIPKYTSDPVVTVPPLGVAQLEISAVDGGAEASPSQSGVLVLWRDGMQGKEASIIQVH